MSDCDEDTKSGLITTVGANSTRRLAYEDRLHDLHMVVYHMALDVNRLITAGRETIPDANCFASGLVARGDDFDQKVAATRSVREYVSTCMLQEKFADLRSILEDLVERRDRQERAATEAAFVSITTQYPEVAVSESSTTHTHAEKRDGNHSVGYTPQVYHHGTPTSSTTETDEEQISRKRRRELAKRRQQALNELKDVEQQLRPTRRQETRAGPCNFCDGPHELENCDMPAEFIEAAIEDKQLCSNCGKSDHTDKSCGSRTNCHICDHRHLTKICPQRGVLEVVKSWSEQQREDFVRGHPKCSICEADTHHTDHCHLRECLQVLKQLTRRERRDFIEKHRREE